MKRIWIFLGLMLPLALLLAIGFLKTMGTEAVLLFISPFATLFTGTLLYAAGLMVLYFFYLSRCLYYQKREKVSLESRITELRKEIGRKRGKINRLSKEITKLEEIAKKHRISFREKQVKLLDELDKLDG